MAADRFLSRFFEFLIRAARAQVAQMDIDSRTMARSPFPVSQRWLALLMVLAMRFLSIFVLVRLRSRTGHDRWYLGRNVSRVPTTFSKNKIADIEERRQKNSCRCKFHANLGFPWIRQLSPPRWDPRNRAQSGDTRSSPSGLLWNPIHPTSIFCYLFTKRNASYVINSSSNRDRLFFLRYTIVSPSFLYVSHVLSDLIKNKFVSYYT